MPDPMSPAIAFYYCDDDETMERITSLLIKKGEWFDVRRVTKHRWSICFGVIVQFAPIYQKKLIPVEPQETEIERNVASYKAKKAAEARGTKPRGR